MKQIVFPFLLLAQTASAQFNGGEIRLDSITPNGIHVGNAASPYGTGSTQIDSVRHEWYVHLAGFEDCHFRLQGGDEVVVPGVGASCNIERKAWVYCDGTPVLYSSNRLHVPLDSVIFEYGVYVQSNKNQRLSTETNAGSLEISYVNLAGNFPGGFSVNGQNCGFPSNRFVDDQPGSKQYDLRSPMLSQGFLLVKAWFDFPVPLRQSFYVR